MRMVSVWLPHFAIERLKREHPAPALDEKPFALVGAEAHGLILTAVNAAARSESLAVGMGLADARAICPYLLTAPADPAADANTLLQLARSCERYSPSLAVDGEDGLKLDVTGIPHLFGGEQKLLADLKAKLTQAGFSAQIALAGTAGAAWALARFSGAPCTILPDGKIKAALAPLPVEALRLAQDTVILLKQLGLKRIGQLYELPRSSLERRFHSKKAAEAVLLRFDQALGYREEPFKPLHPPPRHSVRLAFPDLLISQEGFAVALDQLTQELCTALANAELGARRIALTLWRADGSLAQVEAGLSAPSHEPAHLLGLLSDKTANLDMGFGVDVMLLTAPSADPLPPVQTSLVKDTSKTSPQELIDRLSNRLGENAVRHLHAGQSHIPERAQTALPAMQRPSAWEKSLRPRPPRPPFLLVRPEPLSVLAEVPEGPPVRFTWRRVTRRVVKAEGPERICPEWWLNSSRCKGEDGAARSAESTISPDPLPGPTPSRGREQSRPRDYYRIEDEEGRRYWVFREGLYQAQAEEGPPAWFLHGVFG